MNKITTSNLPSLIGPRGIGFDRIFDLLDEAIPHTGTSFPPYNIIKKTENDFLIELAVAGYDLGDITITQDGNKLQIVGNKVDMTDKGDSTDAPVYLHRGISERSFTREFVLAEHVVVDGANADNGILTIEMHREVPEALKPKTIEIKRLK